MTASRDVRLDELLRYEEEPAADRPARPTRLWLVTTVLTAAALSVLTVLGARAVGLGLPYPLVFGGTLALLLLRRLVRQVPPAPPPRPVVPDPDEMAPPQDGMAVAAARWSTRLNWTQSDAEAFSRTVRPAIAELAEERLRQRHGVTRDGDPARARDLLGDPLWTFLTTPVTRPPTPQQLAVLIGELERL